MNLRFRTLYVPLALAIMAAACFDVQDPTAPQVSEDRVEIIEDEAVLALRVTERPELDLGLDASSVSTARTPSEVRSAVAAQQGFQLKLVGEVRPPTVDGVELEATHVTLRAGLAFVSYAKTGGQTVGAVDMFLVSNPSRPRLIASARFRDTDVLSITTDGLNFYAGEGTSDTAAATPARVERVGITGNRLRPNTSRTSVPGFVATGLAAGGGRIYIASGTSGGLTALDRSLRPIAQDPFSDARAVAQSGRWLVALQGQPGRLRIYDPASLKLKATIPLGGLGVRGAKAAIDIDGDFAFASLGGGGMALVDLRAEQVAATLGPPSMPGVASADAVTNAVTVAGRMVFLAQGGAGVWVASSGHRSGQPGLTPLGRIAFQGPVSSNYVRARGSTLFVAAGRGGLKVVKIVDDGP